MNFEQTSELENTRKKLRNWGRWSNSILTMGLGYKKSIIAQLIDSEGELIRSTAKQLAPDNEEAEMIDALINKLAEREFEKAKVLRIHYTISGKFDIKVLKSNLPQTTYFRYLNIAEAWINNQISY